MLLAPDELARLLKLLGMLGSEHSGERAAAALKAHQFVESRELTWAELLDPADAPLPIVSVGVAAANPAPRPAPQPRPIRPRPSAPPPPPSNPIPPETMWPDSLRNDVYTAIRRGDLIDAVCALRTAFSCDMVTAVNAVNSITTVPAPAPAPAKVVLSTWKDCARHMRHGTCAKLIKGQKEETFLFDLVNRPDATPLTVRQTSWLSDICARANITWTGNPQNMLDPL